MTSVIRDRPDHGRVTGVDSTVCPSQGRTMRYVNGVLTGASASPSTSWESLPMLPLPRTVQENPFSAWPVTLTWVPDRA